MTTEESHSIDMLGALLGDDELARRNALRAIEGMPEHVRSGAAAKLAPIAREAAAAGNDEARLVRACVALSVLRVELARHCLLRIADEGSVMVKTALALALRGTKTATGRAVLVHFLSDDDVRNAAIGAIGEAPWPEVLPALIEMAEADEDAAALALGPIADCGLRGGSGEANAAVDFLLEQLDDESAVVSATVGLVRLSAGVAPLVEVARRLARRPSARTVPCLCVVAVDGHEDDAQFVELARTAGPVEADAARRLLEPLRKSADDRVRAAAERTWRALDL